jgi:hypothetical protein
MVFRLEAKVCNETIKILSLHSPAGLGKLRSSETGGRDGGGGCNAKVAFPSDWVTIAGPRFNDPGLRYMRRINPPTCIRERCSVMRF